MPRVANGDNGSMYNENSHLLATTCRTPGWNNGFAQSV
jgi:hypothetical protein